MKLLPLLIISIILLSCNKNNTTPTPQLNTKGSIQYKVNGTAISMDNANVLSGEAVVFSKELKGSMLAHTRYALKAQQGSSNALILNIQADSLLQVNYHYDSVTVSTNPSELLFLVDFNGQVASLVFSSDNFDINITSYQNSAISGTFTGKLSPGSVYNTRGTFVITDGVFNNIPVTY
jgi:hypothetical protein